MKYLISWEYQRVERVPGVFFDTRLIQANDFHLLPAYELMNTMHTVRMITPRLHIRYTPQEDWVVRLAAGRGYRTANIFAENSYRICKLACGFYYSRWNIWVRIETRNCMELRIQSYSLFSI